jgi:hypothetical protein
LATCTLAVVELPTWSALAPGPAGIKVRRIRADV